MFWWRRRKSKQKAKERLQLVLAYDRAKLAPGKMEDLKRDLLEVLHRYFPTEDREVEIEFEQRGERVVLIADIPVRS
ncbi:MAG TPA: cell division topological specificity factor MinE [Oceanithermus profundus]|uniref:Cell division topological specificity factor n=1 Tax=Oceanithermus profundus TaxID=187137 RepID=A0A7C4ZDS9_9DEIN|nr:cell division topological specificity factor MinE [Oceanithermus profundus]